MSTQIAIASITTEDHGYYRSDEHTVFRGKFRHQGRANAPYVVRSFPKEGVKLSAIPTVIQSRAYGDLGKPAATYEVAVGDLIEVDGALYEVVEGDWGHDPSLVPVTS